MASFSFAEVATGQRLVVGVGDFAVSREQQCVLSTYSLGSCIGVVAFDPSARLGGILHVMLPESLIAADRAAKQPALFVDTGLPLLMRALIGAGAERSSLNFLVSGGASVLAGHDPFRIGERNSRATLEALSREGLHVQHTIVGGTVNRALHLEIDTGIVTLTTPCEGARYALSA